MTVTPPGNGHCSPIDCVSIHIGDIEPIFDWASHAKQPTTVIVAPVELHQRNLKLRLTDANLPLDAFTFKDPVTIASRVLQSAGSPDGALDRVDRLSLIEDILARDHGATEHFRKIIGSEPSHQVNTIEQARTEIETTTNYHPDRIDAFLQEAASMPSPFDADARNILGGTLAVRRELEQRTTKWISDSAVIRRATRELVATSGGPWHDVFPAAERIVIVGLSDVPAPLVDLLLVVTETCNVAGHWFCRQGTGAFLEERLAELLAIQTPGQAVGT